MNVSHLTCHSSVTLQTLAFLALPWALGAVARADNTDEGCKCCHGTRSQNGGDCSSKVPSNAALVTMLISVFAVMFLYTCVKNCRSERTDDNGAEGDDDTVCTISSDQDKEGKKAKTDPDNRVGTSPV